MNINFASSKSEKPCIAVLLAAFNGMKWIEEQISSIMAQQGVLIKIFISVDPSSDGTLEFCKNLEAKNSSIVTLPFNEKFGGAAHNFFKILKEIDFSEFDYVSLADQDDVWKPDKLLHACQIISKTGAHAYSSNVVAFWPDGRKMLVRKSQAQVRWDFLFESAGPGCTYVMQQELCCEIQRALRNRWTDFQKVGLHDWLIYAFARANGFRWVIDDFPGMLYRQHEKNQVGVNMGWRAHLHRARNIFSGWGFNQSALIADIIGLNDHIFVKQCLNGKKSGLLRLSLHAWECRRRRRDKIIFFLSCIFLCLKNKIY